MPKEDEQKREPRRPESLKRVYARPTLIEYGSVSKLTKGGGSNVSDSGTTQKMCL
jgi:hypothetical protein